MQEFQENAENAENAKKSDLRLMALAGAAVCLVLAAIIYAVSGGFGPEAEKEETILAYAARIVSISNGTYRKQYTPYTTNIQLVEKEGKTWHRFTLQYDSRQPLDVLIGDGGKDITFEYLGYTFVPGFIYPKKYQRALIGIAEIIEDFDRHNL